MMKSLLFPAAALALALAPGAAMARAQLVGSTPTANAAASKVTTVHLKFNEKLTPSAVKTELMMTGMPGMKDHPPMKIPFTSAMGKDGKSLTLQLKRALVPGTYKVKWSTASADIQRTADEFSFTVK